MSTLQSKHSYKWKMESIEIKLYGPLVFSGMSDSEY